MYGTGMYGGGMYGPGHMGALPLARDATPEAKFNLNLQTCYTCLCVVLHRGICNAICPPHAGPYDPNDPHGPPQPPSAWQAMLHAISGGQNVV